MAETIILANGRAYKRSAFGELRFYSKGWVIGFELNGVYYVSLYKNKGTGKFTHFVKAQEYRKFKNLKGAERKEALSPHYLSQSAISQFLAVSGDRVNIQIRKRITQNDGTYKLCVQVKSWDYFGETYGTIPYSPVLSPPSETTVVNSSVTEDCLYVTPEGQQIYDMAKRRIGNFSGDLVWDMNVVEDVVEILAKLKPDVTQALENLGLINLYDEEVSLWHQDADLGYYYYTNQQLIEYRDYLISFNKWYLVNKERFQTGNNIDKLYWLLFYFDRKVLSTISYEDKVQVLDKFLTENIDERYITGSILREPLVLKLLRSINDSEASDFLEALLEKPKVYKEDGVTVLKDLDVYDNSIRLRALYKAIDDKRFIIFGNDNRKKFVEIITALWKKSKYSFYSYNQPTDNDQNLDTTSYFNNGGLRYFIDDGNPYWYIENPESQHLGEPVIELGYRGTWYDEQGQIENFWRFTYNYNWKYTSGSDNDFVNEIITIHQSKDYTLVYGDVVLNGLEFVESKRELKYHAYQPIKFLQYEEEGNRMLSVETIPALSFFYEQEYQKLKELDAAIVFAAELSLEVLFFAISGGASALAQIRHLRHVTKLGRGISGVGNAVKVWRRAEITLEPLSFSTGVISSTFNYLASTADVNSPEYEKYKDLRAFFGLLALTSGVSAIGARSLAVKKATKLVNNMDVDGVFYNIDPELEHIIRTIGNTDIFITQMRSYLSFLENNHGLANLVNRFDGLSELKKIAFYEDFNDLKNINSWTEISNSNEAFDSWLALKNVDCPDAKIVNVITNQNRTSGYLRYYNEDVAKAFLSSGKYTPEQRVAFIDEFGGTEDAIFNNFNNNPYGIELGMQGIFPVATSGDVLKLDKIKNILRTTFAANEFDVLGFIAMKNSLKWSEVEPSFLNVIDEFIPMSKTELASFRNEFSQHLPNDGFVRGLFYRSNRLRVTTKRYQDNVLIDEIIELFISGEKTQVDPILNNFPPAIRNKFVEPINDELYYNVFNRASIDVTNARARFNDTEVKYIYNYLINHIGSGNRVVMEIESVLYTCPSCRKYLIALKKYAETQNIDLTIISRAHPKAFKNDDVITIINE